MSTSVYEVIKRKRTNLLIHSYVYYRLDKNIISDHKFDLIATELKALQDEHGELHGFYDAAFQNWTGSTGMHIAHMLGPELEARAVDLLHRFSQNSR